MAFRKLLEETGIAGPGVPFAQATGESLLFKDGFTPGLLYIARRNTGIIPPTDQSLF